jgi:hypothetical protein
MKVTDPETIGSQEFASRIQDHLNHYIKAADRKASILLTGHLAFLGLYANLVKPVLSEPTWLELVLIAATAVLTIIAGGFSLSVVYPRTPETPQGYMLWTSILDRDEEEYREELKDLEPDSILTEMVDENYALAEVADQKYRHFRWSVHITIAMVASALASYLFVVV